MQLIVSLLLGAGIAVDLYTSLLPSPSPLILKTQFFTPYACAPARDGDSNWHQDLMEKLALNEGRYKAALILLSSVSPNAALDAADYLHARGAKVLIRLSSQGRFKELTPDKRQRVARQAHFVVHSYSGASELVQHGIPKEQIFVIPNAVAKSFLSSPLTEVGQPSNARSVLSASRFDRKKCLDVLIDGWRLVEEAFPLSELRIIGSDKWELWKGRGSVRREIYDRAREASLRRLRFFNECPHHAMVEHYRNSDLAVSASENEGMSNFILESMAAGLPIICSDIPANDFIEVGRNGWKFKVGDYNSLSDTICRAMSESLRNLAAMGRYNHKWASATLDPRHIRRLYLNSLGLE